MEGKILLTICLLFVFSAQSFAQGQVNKNENNVAINGYDVVSYFQANGPMKGSDQFSLTHDGVQYHFSSVENKNLFEEDKNKYLPKYGGFCAFGLAKTGKTFPVDPTSYKIIDDELYLFFVGPVQGKMTDTKELWNMDEQSLSLAAEKAWKSKE